MTRNRKVDFYSHGLKSTLVESFFLLKSNIVVGEDFTRFSVVTNPMFKNQFASSFTGDVFCTRDELGKSGQGINNGENVVVIVELIKRDEIHKNGVIGNLWNW